MTRTGHPTMLAGADEVIERWLARRGSAIAVNLREITTDGIGTSLSRDRIAALRGMASCEAMGARQLL